MYCSSRAHARVGGVERVQSPADKTRARVSKRAGRAPRRLAKAVVFYRRVPASVILALRFKRKAALNILVCYSR